MNVFIDSNILFEDYFFENKSNRKLLDYCEQGLLHLYISEVVKLELRRQFEEELKSRNKHIQKFNKDNSRLKIIATIKEIEISRILKEFDLFYQRLPDNFTILPYKNEFLPDLIHRAVYRVKPFTEEKSEFRDAVIWKTYAAYVELSKISDCILLTKNTSDFCTKKDKTKIHLELQRDTKRFSVVNESFQFIKKYASTLESPESYFKAYINQLVIDQKFTFQIISDNFEKKVADRIEKDIDTLHPSDIVGADYFFDGQLIYLGCELLDCEDIEYEILSETALISGKLNVSSETQVLEYNSVRDPGEDQYSIVAEKFIVYELLFNFDLKSNEVYSDFEITDATIFRVD